MNIKRLFAGVVAAATAFGGLAVGATSAQAVEAADAQTITVSNVHSNMPFAAYQLATFTDEQIADNTVQSMHVVTNPASRDAQLAALAQVDGVQTPLEAPYDTEPAAYAATLSESQLRQFAQTLAQDTTTLGAASGTTRFDEAAATATISGLAQGWYLVTSTHAGVVPAIVASTIDGATSIARTNPALQAIALGEVVAKHNETPNMTKTVDTGVDADGEINSAVGIGSTLDYTVSAALPNRQAGNIVDNTGTLKFRVFDRPSKGLTVDTNNIEVFVDDVKLDPSQYSVKKTTFIANGDGTFMPRATVPFAGEFVGDGSTAFVINLDDYVNSAIGEQNAGKTVKIAYTATVNSRAVGSVTNYADVATVVNEDLTFAVKSNDVPLGQLEFLTWSEDAPTGLAGAKFQIKNAQDELLTFVANADGTYTYDPTNAATNTQTLTTPEAPKNLVVNGLPQGVYTIVETEAPLGYTAQFLPTFHVHVAAIGMMTADEAGVVSSTPVWSLKKADAMGLATGTQNDLKVKNVKLITQLPMTGGAGIALFIGIALLLGGGAVVVTMRSRKLKRQLQA